MSDLYVTRLTLSHFRSHKRARVEVGPQPVAIFGANGAGKTNLLEAVSLLSPGRGMRGVAAADMARQPEALGWKLTAQITSLGHAHEIEIWSENGQPRQVRIDGKPAPQGALGRLARVLWLVPSMDRLWIEGAEGRRRFFDRATLSFYPDHADVSIRYEKAMRERNRLLKDQQNDPYWYDAVEAQMAQAAAKIIQHRKAALIRLTEAQDGAETAFPTADLALTHPEVDLPETVDDLQEALAQNRARDMAAGRTLIGTHRVDLDATYAAKNTAARLSSTGEQKALLVSLILANARALVQDFGAPPLLLLDEITAHLDADRRAALFDEICAIGAQAWMTGTGPELFADLKGRANSLEVREAGGISEVIQHMDVPLT